MSAAGRRHGDCCVGVTWAAGRVGETKGQDSRARSAARLGITVAVGDVFWSRTFIPTSL